MPKVLKMKVQEIKVDLIDEPAGVVRMEIDPEEVQDLAKNIKEIGLLQPVDVRPIGERFEIVFGHRRVKALQLLGYKKIPCIVGDRDDVGTALARASENIRRVDLSPIEEAAIYADLHDKHGLSNEAIGKKMGKSAGVVKRRRDMLRMPPGLQKAIHRKQISISVAEELWSIGDEEGISYYLEFAVEHGVTQAVARGWAQDWKKKKRGRENGTGKGDPLASPMEVEPTYITCDFCHGPVELGKDTVLRGCAGCVEKIKAAIRG